MKSLVCLSAAMFVSSMLVVADQSGKPDFTGKWQLDAAKSELHGDTPGATWIIEQKDGNIHIAANDLGHKVEWNCSTLGKECAAAGEKAKASFWYNGPLLVEMETRGDNVTRYRMKLAPDGNSLNVDVTYIVPQNEKPEKLVFAKQP